jgi:hypothetical protein
MGFDVGRTFKLEWPDTHFLHGATIRMRSSNVGLSLDVKTGMTWVDLVRAMCAHVIEWDLERDGEAIDPKSPEAVLATLDQPILTDIAKAWQDASSGVTAPLDTASGDGPASPDTEELELSMRMESL